MPKDTCSIDGCEKPAKTRGWCSMHYERWRVSATPSEKKPKATEIVVGGEYAQLTVLELLETRARDGSLLYRCICACGKHTDVSSSSLRSGNTQSCGCLHARGSAERGRQFLTRHGLTNKHPLYGTWKTMRQRCNDPNATGYERYGARGIRVDPRWDDFAQFVADMGDRPAGKTLDRIDNDGPYSPENCRWATPGEQRANQRPKYNRS